MNYLPEKFKWVIAKIISIHPQSKEHKPYWTEARYIGDGEWEDHLGDPLVITYYKILDWIPKPLEK